MQKVVSLKLVDPNPFRHMDRYPINRTKVDDLKASMGRTGFWDNVVARKVGDRYQLAYGHHRWIAFKEEYGKDAEIPLSIKNLSDEDMIRVMADENMSDYSTLAEVEQETIRAVVQAYAEGKIELEKVPTDNAKRKGGGGGLRCAPNFSVLSFNDLKTKENPKPYNAESIARFLGWMSGNQVSPRIRNALFALEAGEELGASDEIAEMTRGFPSEVAKELVQTVKSIKEDAEKQGRNKKIASKRGLNAGKDQAEKARERLRKGDPANKREIRGTRDKYKIKTPKSKKKEIPDIAVFVENLAGEFDSFMRGDNTANSFDEMMKYKEYVDEKAQKKLVKVLQGLMSRLEKAVDRLEGKTVGTKVALLEN
jgi:hypothetical protein